MNIRNYVTRITKTAAQSGSRAEIIKGVMIVGVAIIVGSLGVFFLKAATYAVNIEAEAGTLTGGSAKVTDATASNGSTVAFAAVAAAPPTTPANLKTFTGGTSIALRWDGSTVSGSTIKQYDIIRNGTQVASVTPGFHSDFPEKDGNGYIDTNVTKGTTYTYQVKAVSIANATSALSSSVSATHPTSTTAVPNITIDTATTPSDLLAYVQSAKTMLQIWYPKLVDALDRPDYAPATSFTIRAKENNTELAGTINGVITINAQYARDEPHDFGVWIHESTHIIQNYNSGYSAGWIVDGIADWSREFVVRDRAPSQPKPGNIYTQSYSQGSFFINWIQDTYSPGIVHRANVTAHSSKNVDDYIRSQTGKTVDQLWAELTSKSYSSAGPLKISSGKCLDIPNGVQTDRTRLQLYDCNGLDPQKWRIVYDDMNLGRNGTFDIRAYDSHCVDIQSSSTADGAVIWEFGCNDGNAQLWRIGANGSLVNPHSGKCLATEGGSTATSALLVLSTCNGSDAQRWTLPS